VNRGAPLASSFAPMREVLSAKRARSGWCDFFRTCRAFRPLRLFRPLACSLSQDPTNVNRLRRSRSDCARSRARFSSSTIRCSTWRRRSTSAMCKHDRRFLPEIKRRLVWRILANPLRSPRDRHRLSMGWTIFKRCASSAAQGRTRAYRA